MTTLNANTMHEIMAILAEKRPEFCSEADFQFALGWEIKEYFSGENANVEIRFECPALLDGKSYVEVDIVVKLNDELFLIELKNPTKEGGRTTNNRCDMIKDIERLEKLQPCNLYVQTFANSRTWKGFTIWLTDDEVYKNKTAEVHNCNITDGAVVHSDYLYHSGKKEGMPIAKIVNNYTIKWEEYKNGDNDKPLWYALITIPPKTQ